jgi:hypothetical protein
MSEIPNPPAAAELAAFATLLDEVVPPCAERGLPGAGEAGLASQLADEVPDLMPTVRQGLAALDEKARARGAAGFAALPRPERAAVLTELAAEDPGFLPGLLYHTYSRYYRLPRVLEGLGLEARPPFPKGYDVAPTDPERLAEMRKRPRLYREV